MLGTAFFFFGKSYLINEYRDKMDTNADEIVSTASILATDDSLDSWDLRLLISSMSTSYGNHIFITDANGTVVLCSEKTIMCDHIGKTLSTDIMTLLDTQGSMDQLSSLESFYPETRFVVAKPITNADGLLIGYAFISSNTSTITSAYESFAWVSVSVVIAVMLMSLLLSYIFTKKLAEPLDEMAVASRKFAHGDFSARIKNEQCRTDEIGILIDSFNDMADSLEKSEARRKEFIGNVSHELRTPMTTIAGFADGILDGTIPKEEEQKYLSAISSETKRLSRLVRGMLDTSQLQAKASDLSRRKDFDISEQIIQTLLSFEKRASEKNLDMDLQLPEDPIIVHADKDAITEVIYNLIDNALKFAFKGSTITLRLYKNAGKAYISIKDTGATIPPDDLPFIFDRFHKSDKSRSLDKDGVGLGLYLVKTIINSHDEDIICTSKDNVTEFVFTLALAKPKEPEHAKPEKKASDKTKKIIKPKTKTKKSKETEDGKQ